MNRRRFFTSLAVVAVASAAQWSGASFPQIRPRNFAEHIYSAWETQDREKYRVFMSAAYKPIQVMVTTGKWVKVGDRTLWQNVAAIQ